MLTNLVQVKNTTQIMSKLRQVVLWKPNPKTVNSTNQDL